jgi:hypothetical protein
MCENAMNTTMPLYTPHAPDALHDMVYERNFATRRITVALRPLSLPGDWPHIGKWLYREFAKRLSPAAHLPEKHLRETFATMLQCDFAQPFIGFINDQPGFLIEICDGDKQCEGLEEGSPVFERGDHAIRLVLSPTVIDSRNWSAYALLSSLEYFFSYSEVNRIVWMVHEKERRHIQLAQQLQFRKGAVRNFQHIHVFLYSREMGTRIRDSYRQQIQKLP